MPLHPDEEATIRAFIKREKLDRYLTSLANSKRRARFLDCLNHCRDFDVRYVEELVSTADVHSLLIARRAPPVCFIISDVRSLDGQSMPLAEAIGTAEFAGFGTILCCIPGRLAYYVDEAGEKRRLLLERGS
jgi:hypothetical protein